MSARTTRTRLFAATTVALAALALTACEGGSDTDAGSGPSTSATATGTNTPSTDASASTGTDGDKGTSGTTTGSGTDTNGSTGSTGSAGSSGSGGKSDGSSGEGSSSGDGGSGAQGGGDEDEMPGKCSASDVKITAQKLSRPLNHLLLTATNTGSKTCMLPPYPAARFGEAQSVPPVAEATKPQSLTGVGPGEAGYAGVILSSGDGSGENGYQTDTLTIPFEDGSIATVALPAGGVYVDTALTVTYWQSDMDAALGH
ncbi:DUF4232 domain-containing protein [Streptomyces sp. SID5910]|uniref:DUF4232 domain-containing protein n=1 Tax=Streptomyces sp. SID5910 TaxID=2690312 RepID=UPI00137096B9|nr:DUF4232 domain-containing protein [Streptomyces sp. SID5910]MYR43523.1 DUF4232 domain-containing protein [Streptomyces sp. SID5910]